MMLQELYFAQTLGTSKTDAPRIGNETQYIDGKSEDILKDKSTSHNSQIVFLFSWYIYTVRHTADKLEEQHMLGTHMLSLSIFQIFLIIRTYEPFILGFAGKIYSLGLLDKVNKASTLSIFYLGYLSAKTS